MLAACLVALTFADSHGAITQFQDKVAWSAAAGPRNLFQNFNSFVTDTPFRIANGPLALNGFTLAETGTTSISDLNFVDVQPLIFDVHNVDGTALVQGGTDFGVTFMELKPTVPIRAF